MSHQIKQPSFCVLIESSLDVGLCHCSSFWISACFGGLFINLSIYLCLPGPDCSEHLLKTERYPQFLCFLPAFGSSSLNYIVTACGMTLTTSDFFFFNLTVVHQSALSSHLCPLLSNSLAQPCLFSVADF